MTTRNYEAMFILENNAASADFEATAGKVDEILEKHGATLVQKEKWDERKLAYEIRGHRRGTYYLVYFTSGPSSLDAMTEDLHLTEVVLRHMFIVLDAPIDEHIATRDAERERLAEDSRRSSLGWGGGGRRGGRGAPRKPAPKEGDAAKPAEGAAADAKPTDAKPEEAKPTDAKPEEAKPTDAKPEDAKPEDAKPEEAKPADAKSDATSEEGAKPEEGASAEAGGSEETTEKEAASKP